MAPFQLTCRRADNGEVVWKSADLADYAAFDLVGPADAGQRQAVHHRQDRAEPPAAAQGQPQQVVLAIQPHDGKILWKTEVGSFRQGSRCSSTGTRDTARPSRGSSTGRGRSTSTRTSACSVGSTPTPGCSIGDTATRPTPTSPSRYFFYYYQPQEPTAGPVLRSQSGEALLIKGMQSDRLYAIDPDRMKVLWERPITKASRLLGVDDRTVFLGGAELSAMDLKTRKLLWATRLPGGSMESRVLVRPDGLWQLTSRGIYEIDPTSGDVRRIFRGKDLGAVGGDLLLTDRWLLSVSNRTISAYPVGAGPARRRACSARVEIRHHKEKASP